MGYHMINHTLHIDGCPSSAGFTKDEHDLLANVTLIFSGQPPCGAAHGRRRLRLLSLPLSRCPPLVRTRRCSLAAHHQSPRCFCAHVSHMIVLHGHASAPCSPHPGMSIIGCIFILYSFQMLRKFERQEMDSDETDKGCCCRNGENGQADESPLVWSLTVVNLLQAGNEFVGCLLTVTLDDPTGTMPGGDRVQVVRAQSMRARLHELCADNFVPSNSSPTHCTC